MPGHINKVRKGSTASAAGNIGGKPRIRTSTACCACRERRIRCVIAPGETRCSYCDQSDIECVISDNDERKRPTSKAYTSTLTNRIQLLEKMLIERGAEPPPVVYPPKTKDRRSFSMFEQSESQDPRKRLNANDLPNPEPLENTISEPQTNQPEIHIDPDRRSFETILKNFGHSVLDLPSVEPDQPTSNNSDLIDRLLSNRGHLGVDQQSGQEHYYGSTSNCHIYSESIRTTNFENCFIGPSKHQREPPNHTRMTGKIIRSMSQETHDYLMNTFFQRYNTVMHVVHESAFYESRDQGSSQYYSGFLHICILAMGFRFGDKRREDLKRLASPEGQKQESSLHREAKYMLDTELERPGGMPSIQALLLLGELEAGVGRDNTGWMYGGMACRLAFDIGLHLDSRRMDLQEQDVEIRDMTLWACVCSDKYWALYLGRPTSMKKSDMPEIYQATKKSARLGKCLPSGPGTALETQTYEALLDLMVLAGKTTEIGGHTKSTESFNYELYTQVSQLDAELKNWCETLPPQLRWTVENIKDAPLGFFLLHQQYHCAMILLHRPFTLYPAAAVATTSPGGTHTENDTLLSTISRKTCTIHAVQVAKISAEHRKRFSANHIFFSGIQHTSTAATSLIGALLHTSDPDERKEYLNHLECLAACLSEMTESYKPAEAVSDVLKAVMIELREPLVNSPGSKGFPTSPSRVRRSSETRHGGHDYLMARTPDYSFALQNSIAPHPYDALYGFMGSDLMFSNYLGLEHTTT